MASRRGDVDRARLHLDHGRRDEPRAERGKPLASEPTWRLNTRRKWLVAGAAVPVVVGWLSAGSPDGVRIALNLFNEGMAALGWKLGTTGRHGDRVERCRGRAESEGR